MKIITFGCRLNAFESSLMEGLSYPENAIIFNTCAVTAEAERQCRQEIRKIHALYPNAPLIVVGCAAQLNPKMYAALPGVVSVLGNREKLCPPKAKEKIQVGSLSGGVAVPEFLPKTGHLRSFLQIQQGCDNACTFCVTRLVRGKNTGLPIAKVLEQVKTLVHLGAQEITLTGVNTASYPFGFVPLIQQILDLGLVKRLRFGSLDPALLTEDFVRLMAHPTLMPHLHFSLQAGCDSVLKRMGRRHKVDGVQKLFNALRTVRPDITFGADIIAGFPEETQKEFDKTYQFIGDNFITHLHVFPYSVRPGTPAEKREQVPIPTRKARAKKLRLLGEELFQTLCDRFVGTTQEVLIENGQEGYTPHYIKTALSHPTSNGITPVVITGKEAHGLVGHL